MIRIIVLECLWKLGKNELRHGKEILMHITEEVADLIELEVCRSNKLRSAGEVVGDRN